MPRPAPVSTLLPLTAGWRLLPVSRMWSFCGSTPFSCAAQTVQERRRSAIARSVFMESPFAQTLLNTLVGNACEHNATNRRIQDGLRITKALMPFQGEGEG